MAESAKWYVLHTYSGYENAVATTIEKAVDNRRMNDLIFEVKIPMETVTETNDSGVTKVVERKVFPGYVLIKMILTDESWHLVRNTRGVTGFVGSANKPIPLTKEEIDALGMDRQVVEVDFKVGDTVKVTDGAFEGFSGVVDEVDVDKKRLNIIVTMFGRETPINLEFDEAEVVKD
ncbi:MAG: transcription termination/antitermination factor NusG [Oscillospiraceae bacterium]|nr:transcription termination/antitermination factor NusG [Oscillospiraceae bacterium]